MIPSLSDQTQRFFIIKMWPSLISSMTWTMPLPPPHTHTHAHTHTHKVLALLTTEWTRVDVQVVHVHWAHMMPRDQCAFLFVLETWMHPNFHISFMNINGRNPSNFRFCLIERVSLENLLKWNFVDTNSFK